MTTRRTLGTTLTLSVLGLFGLAACGDAPGTESVGTQSQASTVDVNTIVTQEANYFLGDGNKQVSKVIKQAHDSTAIVNACHPLSVDEGTWETAVSNGSAVVTNGGPVNLGIYGGSVAMEFSITGNSTFGNSVVNDLYKCIQAYLNWADGTPPACCATSSCTTQFEELACIPNFSSAAVYAETVGIAAIDPAPATLTAALGGSTGSAAAATSDGTATTAHNVSTSNTNNSLGVTGGTPCSNLAAASGYVLNGLTSVHGSWIQCVCPPGGC